MSRWRLCALLLAAALAVTGCDLQTAGGKKGQLTLHATFDYIQTLVVGHGVQISDIPVGTVTAINLVKGEKEFKARVTFSVEDGVNVPKGTAAVIARTSIFGENYIKLEPPKGTDLVTGPFMKSGEEITKASLQPDLEEIATAVIPVIAAFSGDDLESIAQDSPDQAVDDIDTVTTIKRVRKLLTRYAAMGPEVEKIVDGLGEVGTEFAKNSGQFGKFLDEADQAVRTLSSEEDRMVRTVKSAIKLARTTNTKILQPHTDKLSTMLRQLAPVAEFFGDARKEWEYLIQWGLWVGDAAPRVFHPVLGFLGYGWLRGLASPLPGTVPNIGVEVPGGITWPGPAQPPWAPGEEDPPGRGVPPEDDEWPGQGDPPPYENYDPRPNADSGSTPSQMIPISPAQLAELWSPR